MFAEALDVFLRDFGVACVGNGTGFTGILDTPDETWNTAGINVMSTMYALTVKSSDVAAASLDTGVTITVAGTAYVIRDVVLQDDGAFSVLTLSK